LPFAGFNATGLRSLRLNSQSAALSGGSDLGCLSVVNGNLYYNNGTGVAVQVTAGNVLNSTFNSVANGSGFSVTLAAPTALGSNITLTLPSSVGTANQFVVNNGSASGLTYRSWLAPTIQKLLSTGTTTGYVFTISSSTTCAVGDTYTNNGNTYTVLGALTAQTGQVMFCSGASAPLSSAHSLLKRNR
jgi:hypothetical protein